MADKNMEAQISVEFEEATSRQSLNSGETINTLWGKVKRWLSDLKAVAFSGSYNDLSDTPTTATKDTDGLMSAEDKSKLDNADDTYALKSKYGDTTINVGRKAGTIVGHFSTAEGQATTANSLCSHAEGDQTTASGNFSHSEGEQTKAIGVYSHAEGCGTEANGRASHAEGRETTAFGDYSHTSGYYTKALHDNEAAYGKYNESNDNTLFSIGDGTADDARHNAFEITTTGGKLHDKDIATTDLIPTELPANGGNADTVDNVHISCTNDATPNINWFAAFTNENNLRAIDPGRAYVGNAGLLKPTLIGTDESCTYHTILDWANSVNGMGQAHTLAAGGFPSDTPVSDEGLITVETDFENKRKVVTFKSYGSGRGTYRRNIWSGEWRWDWQDIANGGNADTLDGLHADDFVNANDRDQIQIPSNVDVPVWVHTNGKRFQRYMTNGANVGLTNVPNNSTDYVWYWYDGLNILAREWATGKYYICDMINGNFSGWKDVYTSGYKPYVTGAVSTKYGEKANVSFGFTPSMVLYRPVSPKSNIPGSIYVATMGVDANGFTPNQATYNQQDSCAFAYIAFK